eukprot:TRINITY_DN1896_c0_g1_i1.p1 TRINITY_DN1896_c0_g1~~TRINITY_DN1896_c0_g1_i1.p1  ORF type:complete len:465 (+),score=147.73 TRINITY_DN1896_c0_g1_i1:64-1395(+)
MTTDQKQSSSSSATYDPLRPGFKNIFDNPMSDKFEVIKFDHLEFTTADATTTMKVLKRGLGMELIAQSKKETGNHSFCSYVLKSNGVKFVVTAPYLSEFHHPNDQPVLPHYSAEKAKEFYSRHGTGVSAVAIEVVDVKKAYETSVSGGAIGRQAPYELKGSKGHVVIAEVALYSDTTSSVPSHQTITVLRFIEYHGEREAFLPGYQAVKDPHPLDYGISHIDHVVGNVFDMEKVIAQMKDSFGFHTFSKFSKEDINTPWTSLNSEVLSSNNSRVLFPVNETAPGKKESQITEYLKAYNGPGVQHIALKTSNVVQTVKTMKENQDMGFEFMKSPNQYYHDANIVRLMKENLTEEEADAVIELGILVDDDNGGLLLQIFTKPLFDRPTLFVEIIQRKCAGETMDLPGCGGFGHGNFKALFEAIERMQEERGGLLDDHSSLSGKPC